MNTCTVSDSLQMAITHFAVMYFFPMYFETVVLTSASEAGKASRYPLYNYNLYHVYDFRGASPPQQCCHVVRIIICWVRYILIILHFRIKATTNNKLRRWMMSATGRYKLLDSISGIGPFFATVSCFSKRNEASIHFYFFA